MVGDDEIRRIFETYKTIATIGFSKDPAKPSHYVPKFLIERGYEVIPVNPTVNEILGRRSYSKLSEVPLNIDIVQVFRPSPELRGIVNEAISRRRERGDVKVIWAQEGIRDDEAAKEAKEVGFTFIQDRCMYKEYVRLIGV
ncbi:CoA-binding protein [Sulfodiicoccus acidiphilus]|nr:CoA-binding protein [Sulfodiicoccus acidiphilus]